MGERDHAGLQGEQPGSLRVVGRVVPLAGYVHGLRQPCLQVTIREEGLLAEAPLDLADRWIRDTFAGTSTPPPARTGHPLLESLLDWTRRILESRGQPVLDLPKVFKAQGGGWTICHPCLAFGACEVAIKLALDVMNVNLAAGETDPDAVRQTGEATLERYGAILDHGRLYGFNALHFAQAAHTLGIPWQRVSSRILQVGLGASARLLDSSMTDQTSIIGTMLARDKVRSSQVMRAGGLPVADHHVVTTADEAQAAAERLEYPVVVKPVDSDGGQGVTAFLHGAETVRQAFARAREVSRRVMVEKHAEGSDYRFHVVDGAVIGAVVRSPAAVTGDGRRSVRELVEAENHARRTAADDRRHLHPIEMDEEAETILAVTGQTWDSVPPAGAVLRLRGAASVARGGVPRELDLAEIHPDNLALAIRAARMLPLDVAGVDIILPEIGGSWLETGAAICEVNSSPNMFTTFHEPSLRRLMKGGNGRIPTVLVLGSSPGEQLSGAIHARLCERGIVAGLVGRDGPLLGRDRPFADPSGTYDATVALIRDPLLEALVISVADQQVMHHGWPIDRCDAIVFVRGAGGNGSAEAAKGFAVHASVATDLAPRAVFIDAGDSECSSVGRRHRWASVRAIEEVHANQAPLEELAAAVVDQLLGQPAQR